MFARCLCKVDRKWQGGQWAQTCCLQPRDHCRQAPRTLPQRHGESETTGGKLLNIGFKAVLDIIGLIVQAEFNDDNGHTLVTSFSLPNALS